MEMGLGVTPWSPLKGGVLTGKYTRENAGKVEPGRGEWVTSALNARNYDIVDVLCRVAGEVGSTPSRVALAWVQSRPGVTSTIIGARTMTQLEDNLEALDLEIGAGHQADLDAVSRPKLDFPAEFLERSPAFAFAGTTINGQSTPVLPLMPTDEDRY